MVLLLFYILGLAIILAALVLSLVTRNRELLKRCLTLAGLIHLVCLTLWAGSQVFAVLMLLIAMAGAVEVSLGAGLNRLRAGLMAVAAALLCIALKYAGFPPIVLFVPSISLCVALMIPGGARLAASGGGAVFILGLIVPGVVALSDLFDLSSSHVIALILLVQFNDAFAYLAGKRFGKTKLAFVSAISPNKTLEGYAAGAAAALVAAILLHTLIPAYAADGVALRIAAQVTAVFLLGNAGDLAFSAMKRHLGIKDFSQALAGHGGIMDRFDSLLCLAPLYLLLAPLF